MINIQNLSYGSPSGEQFFDDVSAAFPDRKTGLVGRNGSGKTTLLRFIMSEILPDGGKIETDSFISYMPQDYQLNPKARISDVLGVGEKLRAIRRLERATEQESGALLEIVGDDWDIESRAKAVLSKMNLVDINLGRKISSLLGGQRMRVLLARLLASDANFLLLDEPTNNLDEEGKKLIYRFVHEWHHGLIIVSHDRKLLNLMDEITEISEGKLRNFDGNFESYQEQKQTERETLTRQLISARQELDKDRRNAVAVKERQERRSRRGKDKRMKFGLSRGVKSVFNQMEGQANATTGRLRIKQEGKIQQAQEKFVKLKEQIPEEDRIHIDLSCSRVANGKTVAEFKNVSFSYSPGKELLKDINFLIIGPERIAITGANGAGKTTLIRLLLGEIKPDAGEIYFPISHHAYLDQHLGFMQPDETLIGNLRKMSGQSEDKARNHLARFLFPEDTVFEAFGALSGGERIRAALACVLARRDMPELLILDEPTNNLDLPSLEKLESALLNFEGALIVISHDRALLENIGVTRYITL